MYKKSISFFLISTLSLSLSLSSCSPGVNNTGSNVATVTSSNVVSSVAPKTEQTGPLSLGEIEIQTKQNVNAQEQIITLQKNVNFLQQQAISLQEEANLLQEGAVMTIRIEKDASTPDDPNITMEQRKAEVEKQMKEMAKLAADKQQEAIKAFAEANAQQEEIWKLQGQINTIPQSGLKTQADDPNTAISESEAKIAKLRVLIADIQSRIDKIQQEIADNQSKLAAARTATEKINLTDKIKNLRLSIFAPQQELQKTINDITLEQENILVLQKAIAADAARNKEKELLSQLDKDKAQRDSFQKFVAELNAGQATLVDKYNRLTEEIKKQSNAVNSGCAIPGQLRKDLSAREAFRADVVAKKNDVINANNATLKKIQDRITAKNNQITAYTAQRDNAQRWWNFIGASIYAAERDKAINEARGLNAEYTMMKSMLETNLNAYNDKLRQLDIEIASLRNTLANAENYCNQQKALYDKLVKDADAAKFSYQDLYKQVNGASSDLKHMEDYIQVQAANEQQMNQEARNLEAAEAALRMESAKKEADRQAQLAAALKKAEEEKQKTIKEAEEFINATLNDEKARLAAIKKVEAAELEAIKKAEEAKLAAQQKAEQERQAELKKQQEEAEKQAILKAKQEAERLAVIKAEEARLAAEKLEAEKKAAEEAALKAKQEAEQKELEAKLAEEKARKEKEAMKSPSPYPSATSVPVATPKPVTSSYPIDYSSYSMGYPSVTIVPGSISLTQNNTAIMRVFVKDADGKYITDDSVKIESLNPSIAKIVKIEKGSIEFIVELGFVGAGEAKIKVSTSKTISVFTTTISPPSEHKIMAISVNSPQLLWDKIEGALGYQVVITRVDNPEIQVVYELTSYNFYDLSEKLCTDPVCNGFTIADVGPPPCDDTLIQKNVEYNVLVKAMKDELTPMYTFPTIKIKGQ